ncbi:hypothetical protein MUP77_08385 [Candidatus Bathyarchaeota archaeon]|nr:hypothetical protein [Candidatus Bathyarchaeota archaeon]
MNELYNSELFEVINKNAPSWKKIGINFFIGVATGLASIIPHPLIEAISPMIGVGKDLIEKHDFSKNWLSLVLKARELEQKGKKSKHPSP